MKTVKAEKEQKTLTVADPIDPDTLALFRKLQTTRQGLADRLLSVEQERIQILGAAKKVTDQMNRLFEACLLDRGLPPDTRIEIDDGSGRVTVLGDTLPERAAH